MAFNPTLAGIGVLGTSAVVGGGVAINGIFNEDASVEEIVKARDNPELKAKQKEPGSYHPLFYDNNYFDGSNQKEPGASYKGKYGEKYSRNLIGVTQMRQESEDTGKAKRKTDGGEGSYKYAYKQDSTGGFSNSVITSGKALQAACIKAYKGEYDESKKVVKYKGEIFQESDVGTFCARVRRKPSAVGDSDGYQNGTIGTENKSKLVSTKDPKNDRFGDVKTGYVLGHGSMVQPSDSYVFFKKKYYDDESKKKKSGSPIDIYALKRGCDEAYSKQSGNTSSSENAPSTEEVLRYCSFEDGYGYTT